MALRTTVHRASPVMDEETDQVPASFPYSHRRSDSSYSLAPVPRHALRRNNSVVRTGKDIIPLVLTTEVPAAPGNAAAQSQQHRGHRRGLSVGIKSAPTPQQKPSRPASMFFDRFFNDSNAERRYVPSPPQATRSSSGSSTRTLSSSSQPCKCSKSPSKSSNETRLMAQIANFEAERETKDLTISMLSEQLLDKAQEIELLRCKMAGLERALAGPDAESASLNMPDIIPTHAHSGRDSAIGSAESSSPAMSHAFPARTIKDEDEVDALRDENAALKAEIMRLNVALDDGLGVLSELGL